VQEIGILARQHLEDPLGGGRVDVQPDEDLDVELRPVEGRHRRGLDGLAVGGDLPLLELIEERLRDARVEVGDRAVRRRLKPVRAHHSSSS